MRTACNAHATDSHILVARDRDDVHKCSAVAARCALARAGRNLLTQRLFSRDAPLEHQPEPALLPWQGMWYSPASLVTSSPVVAVLLAPDEPRSAERSARPPSPRASSACDAPALTAARLDRARGRPAADRSAGRSSTRRLSVSSAAPSPQRRASAPGSSSRTRQPIGDVAGAHVVSPERGRASSTPISRSAARST